MPRIEESKETLEAIREKADRNAKENKTYGTKAIFDLGRGVISFEERCQIERHLGRRAS